ncbi:TM2 domain-containing protein [Carnobacterium mobile]|uniref:TM2 domain-containing protein n=1 Tax=Carnobacterium mobile TaxID=2750 RepID=UPI000AB0816F|nr:TM2 domain-containing protein [Carnobacterium mobile]
MYNKLTSEEKMLAYSEVANNKKSTDVAYLLWFFLGSIGIHSFYLNRKGSGITILI